MKNENETKDGGPAFPRPMVVQQGMCEDPAVPGMSLRDYFAASVLPAVLKNNVDDGLYNPRQIAWEAYKIADRMLEARNQ